MTIAIYLLIAFFLLLLNAFFVLAEFAAVKMRASRVEQLVEEGNSRAKLVRHIQSHLDEYLSVCQVGITFASIGLGFVGEPAFAQLLILAFDLESSVAHTVAVTFAYLLVSALHIVLGEQLPKSLAIRDPERFSLSIALPLKIFRVLFFIPLVVLNSSVNMILKLFGASREVTESAHSAEELKIILSESAAKGEVSFDRLLLLENIFDLEGTRVNEIMRPRQSVKVLRADAPWEENFKVVRESRFTRYPLVDGSSDMPLGIVHIKDLLYEGEARLAAADLRKIARPYLTATADAPMEKVLGDLRRRRRHLVMVTDDAGRWIGFLSMEDLVEEIVGTIEDEFEIEPPIFLSDALNARRVVLDLRAPGLEEAVRAAIARVNQQDLPLPASSIVAAVLEREKAMSTYLGNGIAIPHARMEGIKAPAMIFVRSDEGIPVKGRDERATFLFILLTPTASPRDQVRLLSRIAGLVGNDSVRDVLETATEGETIAGAIRSAETIAL